MINPLHVFALLGLALFLALVVGRWMGMRSIYIDSKVRKELRVLLAEKDEQIKRHGNRLHWLRYYQDELDNHRRDFPEDLCQECGTCSKLEQEVNLYAEAVVIIEEKLEKLDTRITKKEEFLGVASAQKVVAS